MPAPDDGSGAAYRRGQQDGETDARLAGHDQHFALINGNLAVISEQLRAMTLAVQRLGDQAEASARTVVSTAAALKEAEAARRASTEQAWSPLTKIFAVIAALAAVVGIYFAIKRGGG